MVKSATVADVRAEMRREDGTRQRAA